MKEKYNALFDKLTPIRSDNELLNAVLDRKAEKMKNGKHFAKKVIIIPAAAAALLCTTVGVSAAYEWNIPAAVADIFGRNSDKIPEGVNFKEFNFTTVGGNELNDVLKFDGYEVQMKGAAANPHGMMLFYDTVFDSEMSEEYLDNFAAVYAIPDMSLFVDYNRNLSAAGTSDDPVFSKEWSWKHIQMATEYHNLYLGSDGNTAHYCFKYAVSGASLAGRSVTLEVGDMNKLSSDDAERQNYTVDLGFVDSGNSLDIYRDNEITLSTGVKGNVSHIQLTPFSVCFRVDWGEQAVETPDENGNISANALDVNTVYNEFKIKLKDGTVMDADAFGTFAKGARRDFTADSTDGITVYAQDPLFEWAYPVNVADVEALIIGNTTISVN